MSRLRAGEQADAPGGGPGGPGPRALTLRPRGCSPSWEGRTGRAGTRPERRGSHSRSRPRPRLPRSPSHRPPPSLRPLLYLPPLSSTSLPSPARIQTKTLFVLFREPGKTCAPLALAPWVTLRAGGSGGARSAAPRPGGDGEEGISGPRVRLSPFLLLFPAPRALTLGEVGCKVSESGVGSCKQSGGRGAGPGRRGQKRSSRRLCSALGERPGEESPGEYRDRRLQHSGLSRGSSLLPSPPPSGILHLHPNPGHWSQVPKPPCTASLYPQTSRPKDPKSGMGKEKEWGRRWAMGRIRPGGWMFALECSLLLFSFALENASHCGPPFSPISPISGFPPLQF